jgi:serine protease AprX
VRLVDAVRGWRARGWQRSAAALLAALTLGGQPAMAQDDDRKLDLHLRERLHKEWDDTRPAKVIVTVRPGARKGLIKKLMAHGATVNEDFTVIDASAAELPLRKLRQLARDKDVIGISVDADVQSDGVATAVTGTAFNGGYSLRSTLGLRGVSSTATTKSFQQGNAGYTGAVDTDVQIYYPSLNNGASSKIEADQDPDPSDGYQFALVRFDNLFGPGTNQIPVGSTITSATLTMGHLADGNSAASASVHQMLVDWTAASTWNSMSVSGAGIQFNNVEARSAADATVSNLAVTGAKVFSGTAVTAAVQAWANGQPNRGWVVKQTQDNGWIMRSSEDSTLANRPMLTVAYKAPVNTMTLTGSGVTVAVIDSGMFEDGGTSGRIKTTRDFIGGNSNPGHSATPLDQYGHGTHVAGLIGGDQTEAEGVAPGAKYVSLRVLDSNGSGSTSNVIKAIQWAVNNRVAQGIDVINLSLGHPVFEPAANDPLVQAVEAASRAGIVVVVSAGNVGMNPSSGQIGYGGITSPGNAPSAITVGSSRTMGTTRRTDDLVSDFSSRGPTWYDAFAKPDVVAPGQHLLAPANTAQTLYSQRSGSRGPSYGGRAYLHLSGTSMATGVVSGTVALMIEKAKLTFGVKPSANAIKAMLQRSAFPLTNASGQRYDVLTQGAGALNAFGATQLAGMLDPRVGTGSNWTTAAPPVTTTVDGQVISWGDNIVWGDNIIWGDSLNTHLTAWNDNIVWGDQTSAVWGSSLISRSLDDNIVWGDNYYWGDNIVWGDNYSIVSGSGDNIVWGDTDNIVWGDSDDNIVWGDTTGYTFP